MSTQLNSNINHAIMYLIIYSLHEYDIPARCYSSISAPIYIKQRHYSLYRPTIAHGINKFKPAIFTYSMHVLSHRQITGCINHHTYPARNRALISQSQASTYVNASPDLSPSPKAKLKVIADDPDLCPPQLYRYPTT